MIIIGEKINATLPGVRSIVQDRKESELLKLVKEQIEAGADYVDVNVSTGYEEVLSIRWAVECIKKEFDIPLCLDSSDPKVLKAGLEVVKSVNTIINSAKADEQNLDQILPLVKDYGASVIILAMSGRQIPKTVEERIQASEKIISALERYSIPRERVYIDPLVLPIATDVTQGTVTLTVISTVKREFPGIKTVLGLSNVSYGLPARHKLNSTFLALAIQSGLDAVIMDPLVGELRETILAVEALLGRDNYCQKFTRYFRARRFTSCSQKSGAGNRVEHT